MQQSSQTVAPSTEKRLSTIFSIETSAFFFGPLGAFYLISRNFSVLGNRREAKLNLIYGTLFTIIVLGGAILIPHQVFDKLPHLMVPIVYTSMISVYARSVQGNAIKQELLAGAKKYPTLKMLGVSLLSLLITSLVGLTCIFLWSWISILLKA